MSWRLRWLAACAPACLGVACGGKDGEFPAGSTNISEGDTSGDSDGNGDGDGDDDTCSGFADVHGPTIDVRIRNDTPQTVYLDTDDVPMCWLDELSVHTEHEVLMREWDGCPTCEVATAGHGCVCPIPIPPCATPSAVRIDPGFTYPTSLSATMVVDRELPAACSNAYSCKSPCEQVQPFPNGVYSVRVRVSDQIACVGDSCDCDIGEQGWCFIRTSSNPAGTLTTATGLLTRPNDEPVTIVIE